MPDKTLQVTTTTPNETGTNQQVTTNPDRTTTTTVKPGGKTSTATTEDFAFQIQFTIPVRGGLGSTANNTT